LLIVVPFVFAGVFLLHFGRHDARALADFSASYERFDGAISSLERDPASDDLARKADEALVELDSRASARISSLTRNDAEIMHAFLEIGNLSRRELETLKAYKRAVADPTANSATLAQEFNDLRDQRATAYARFRALED
jgi:hypothetical protein